MFKRARDRLFVRYIRPYIEASQRHADAPRMPRVHASMTMQPGDMPFVNDYHVLHARAAYEDDRAAGKIRHLKWLRLDTDSLRDDEKPQRFRLCRTDGYWASKGRTKSELDVRRVRAGSSAAADRADEAMRKRSGETMTLARSRRHGHQ